MRISWVRHPEYDEWLRAHDGCGETYAELARRFGREFDLPATRDVVQRRMRKIGISNGICPTGRMFGHNGGWNHGGEAPWQSELGYRGEDCPIGTESVHGHLVRVKVAMRPKKPKGQDHWVYKHILEWERANGRPLPDDRMVLFADGDRSNFDPANLVDVDRRAGHLLLSQPERYPFVDRETLLLQEARVLLGGAIGRATTRGRGDAPMDGRGRKASADGEGIQ